MTLREGRPLPAARTGLGGRPERGGLSPADSAEKRGDAAPRREQELREAPETALRPPLSAGRHVPLPRPGRPVDAGRGVQGEGWPVPSVTEMSPGPGEATGHNDQDVLGSETLGLQPSSAAMAP